MRGGETKILKRGQAGSRDGCLKKEELELPYNLREGCSGGRRRGAGLSESVKKGKFYH